MSEVRKVVEDMNESIFMSNHSEGAYIAYLELIETPIGGYIKFCGHYIWDSENEYREWEVDKESGEETGEREDLKVYLWTQLSLIKNSIYRSMLAIEKNIDNKELS